MVNGDQTEYADMDKKEIKEYNDIIRRMLEHEDEVRNQRTNLFLVIQGLLINAIFMLMTNEDFEPKTIAISLLLFIGTMISLSFLYAAKLSSKASSQGKIFWLDVLNDTKADIKDFPPICLLAKDKFKDQKYKKDLKDRFLPCIFLPFFFSIIEGVLLSIFLPPFFSIIEVILLIWTLCWIFLQKTCTD